MKLLIRLKLYLLFPVRFVIRRIQKRPPKIINFKTEDFILIDKALTVLTWKVNNAYWVNISSIGAVNAEGLKIVENVKIISPLIITIYGYKSVVRSQITHISIKVDSKTNFQPFIKIKPNLLLTFQSVQMMEKLSEKQNVTTKIKTPGFNSFSIKSKISTDLIEQALNKVNTYDIPEEIAS